MLPTPSSRQCSERLVTQAFGDWLQGQGHTLEYLPLQQLFALCHAGVVPRPTRTSISAFTPPLVLGDAVVRLLDGCLATTAALPDPQQRRRAASNVVAAFCRSALREAQLRSGCGSSSCAGDDVRAHDGLAVPYAVTGSAELWGNLVTVGTAEAAAGSDTAAAAAAPLPALGREFLDAVFTLLAAVAARHPVLVTELRLMETAWGVSEPASVESGKPKPRPSGCDAYTAPAPGADAYSPTFATPSQQHQHQHQQEQRQEEQEAESSTEQQLSDFFLGADFQCKLAAGQLLYGVQRGDLEDDGRGRTDGGPEGGSLRYVSAAGVRVMDGDGMDWEAGRGTGRGRLGGSACGARDGEREDAEGEGKGLGDVQEEQQYGVQALAEVPALAELCGAAALADWWPELVGCVADGGGRSAGPLTAWLKQQQQEQVHDNVVRTGGALGDSSGSDGEGCRAACLGRGVQDGLGSRCTEPGGGAGGAGARVRAGDGQRGAPAACRAMLAAALAAHPAAVIPALPPPLLCVLALRDGGMRAALLRGLEVVLAPPPPPAHPLEEADYDAWGWGAMADGGGDGDERRFGADASGGTPEAAAVLMSPEELARVQAHVRRLHACFGAVGWDLGALLQEHLLAVG